MLHCNITNASPYASAMSRQLTLSAGFSVFALAALALAQGAVSARVAPMQTGATTEAAAPVLLFAR